MSKFPAFTIDDHWIISHRGPKNIVDPFKPYDFFIEKERTGPGIIEEVTAIFLTNRECPFRCLMCDLWKNTTDTSVPEGAIPRQIEYALSRLPQTKHLKLYNSGSFFDPKAISTTDYPGIAGLIENFETVLVESHPAFINHNTLLFNELTKPELQVAIGLETIHPEVLPRINKKMTLAHFDKAVDFLLSNKIETRAFILLRPPFLSEEEGIVWAERSIDYAFRAGVKTCTVIPVRSGNGALETLEENGFFEPPDIRSLETVMEYGIKLNKGTVLADLWDIEHFSRCDKCLKNRKERLHQMNLYQKIFPKIDCSCQDD